MYNACLASNQCAFIVSAIDAFVQSSTEEKKNREEQTDNSTIIFDRSIEIFVGSLLSNNSFVFIEAILKIIAWETLLFW